MVLVAHGVFNCSTNGISKMCGVSTYMRNANGSDMSMSNTAASVQLANEDAALLAEHLFPPHTKSSPPASLPAVAPRYGANPHGARPKTQDFVFPTDVETFLKVLWS